MKVSVFGLGYVGTVCAACLAKRGHIVIACDVQAGKVDAINAGVSPVHEPGLAEIVAAERAGGRLLATLEAAEAVRQSELSLVCVGTPSLEDGSVDTTSLERVCEEIHTAVAAVGRRHTVVVRSTALPTAFMDQLLPILKRPGADIAVCCNPEFLREGNAIDDFEQPPLVVVGEYRPGDADTFTELSLGSSVPIIRLRLAEALMVKYASNAFHAAKIAFANEIGMLCQAVGADSHRVMDAFCEDRQLNISPRYLKPGGAFGGSCLPKDLRALISLGRHRNLETPLLAGTIASNRFLIERSLQAIVACGKRRIGLLGLSFKDDTDDLRESPTVEIVERLVGKGFTVLIHDKDVAASRIFGSNLNFVNQHLPHLAALLRPTVEEVIENAEVVVVCKSSTTYAGVSRELRPEQALIDLVRLSPRSESRLDQPSGLVG